MMRKGSTFMMGTRLVVAGLLLAAGGFAGGMALVKLPGSPGSWEETQSEGGTSQYPGEGGEWARGNLWRVDTSRGDVRLACPPGFYDEESSSEVAVPALPVGDLNSPDTNVVALAGGGNSVVVDAEKGGALGGMHTVVAALDYPGALLFGQCVPLRNQLAFSGVSTSTGEDAFLILENPGEKAVDVRVTGFTRGGLLGEGPSITVPAGTTIAWRPAIAFPEEQQLGLVVDAEGTGVAAWVQSAAHEGEVPYGVGYLLGTPLMPVLDFPGAATLTGELTLHLLNPTSEPTTVSVTSLSADGEEPVPGLGSFLAEPGEMSVTVPALPDSAVSLRVTSGGVHLSAGLSAQRKGANDPVAEDLRTQTRLLVAPAEPLEPTPAWDAAGLEESLTEIGLEELSLRLITSLGDTSTAVDAADTVGRELQGAQAWIVEGKIGGNPVSAVLPVVRLTEGSEEQWVVLEP